MRDKVSIGRHNKLEEPTSWSSKGKFYPLFPGPFSSKVQQPSKDREQTSSASSDRSMLARKEAAGFPLTPRQRSSQLIKISRIDRRPSYFNRRRIIEPTEVDSRVYIFIVNRGRSRIHAQRQVSALTLGVREVHGSRCCVERLLRHQDWTICYP